MHIDITPSTERLVRDELSSGHFQSVDDLIVSGVHAWREMHAGSLQSAADIVLEELGKAPAETMASMPKDDAEQSQPRRPLSARIREIWADMPDDARAAYPEGGAYQIDHHIYGLPKR